MGPKLMNCCKPEQMGTKEYGKMLKRIQVLEGCRVPTKDARSWRIAGQKRRVTRKEYQRLLNKFKMEGFMAQKRLWNLVREKIRDKRALPKEEGDVIREYKATHEENFLSNWLKETGKEKEERIVETREENETGSAKRGCVGFVFVEAFDIFRQQ